MRERPAPVERVDVLVIGGGLAGIAAAARLKERGVRAVILEGEPALGGKVRAVDLPSSAAALARGPTPTLSRGPIVWEARRQSVTRLMGMLALGDDVIPTLPATARHVVRNGKLCALQPSLSSLLTTKALTIRNRLHLLAELLRPRRQQLKALGPPGDGGEEGNADESLASFFARRFGHDVAEGLLFAMANGIWAGDPRRLSAATCFPDMVAAERDHGSVIRGTLRRLRRAREEAAAAGSDGPPKGSLTLRGGLGSVGPAASALFDARLGSRVESLEQRGSDVVVRARGSDGRPVTIHARGVVLAVEAFAARALLAAPGVTGVDSILAEVSYAPLALVHWRERQADDARMPAGFGYLSPPRERSFALGALFASDMLPSCAPGAASGRRLFSSFVGGVLTPERARLTDDELARGLAEELHRLTGGRFGEVLHIERVAHAVAQPTLGHAGRMARLEQLLSSSRISVAGSWLGAGAMKDAVDSGFKAADDIAARLTRDVVTFEAARGEPLGAANGSEVVAAADESGLTQEVTARGERRPGVAPLAIVGASYRDVATEVRARLAAVERGVDPPSQALVAAGYADGVVFLETCSRVEWVISSPRPAWAAEILKSTLAMRVPESRVHTKTGHAGAHYLLRVAMGLDSVAEGEPAVGRQLVLAFERAHKSGEADRALRLAWRGVQQLMGERRRRGIVRHGLGVQTLVVEELATKGVATNDVVLVFGQGEIGRAVHGALKDAGYTKAIAHRRATHGEFLAAAQSAHAVIVCTGAPAAFLELPAREIPAIVIDVGVPAQVKAAPGWTQVVLEDLLTQPRRLLDDDTRAWLVAQVHASSDRLSKDLADPAPATALSAIDEARRIFLRETLPPLLERLPQASADEVRRACTAFAHNLMERVRDGSSGGGAQ